MNITLLAMMKDKELDLSKHLGAIEQLELGIVALLLLFFVVRPELWRRLWFDRVDPRPAALMRISFGLVVFITFAVLIFPTGPLPYSTLRYLFSEDGLWLTDTARQNYGGNLRTLWDDEHGFEHWHDVFRAMGDHFSPLFLNSEPSFVFALYGVMLMSLLLMVLGVWTRVTSILSFLLVEWVYRYSPVFYTGGDTVIRVYLFLGMFADWGRAYSLDAWWARRDAILRGQAQHLPALIKIPAWPMRIMMLQLACIYCATGLLKSGATWHNGTALYYALCLDHFYRVPAIHGVTLAQFFGVLPLATIVVHWWEMLFPLALIGVALNAFERERALGVWPRAAAWRRWLGYAMFAAAWVMGAVLLGIGVHYFLPARALPFLPRALVMPVFTGLGVALLLLPVGVVWILRRYFPRGYTFVRHWLLGKRLWLFIGFGMHIGIATSMNVGTFAPVMIAVYMVWFSGEEIDGFWRYMYSEPFPPGEGGRRIHERRWTAWALAPFERLVYRRAREPVVVLHHPGDASVRRAALLRCWDVADRLRFLADASVPPETLRLRLPGTSSTVEGGEAGRALLGLLPGLTVLRPFWFLPGVTALVLRILRQR